MSAIWRFDSGASLRRVARRRQGGATLMFTLDEVETASALVHRYMPPTPQFAWPLLARRFGGEIVVKHENHTPVGAFKLRGGIVYAERLKRERPEVKGIVSRDARQSWAEPRLRRLDLRHAGGDRRATRQFGGKERRHAGARRRVHRDGFRFRRREGRGHQDRRGARLRVRASFAPDLVRGVATYALELFGAHRDIETRLCADRPRLRHLRADRHARRARPEDRDRRRRRRARQCLSPVL